MMAANKLRPALNSAKLSNRPQLLVVDEAHCISSWAESGFRPAYAMAGHLRRLLPPDTPALAVTATANQAVQNNIKEVLSFGDDSHTENLGNYRSNIIHEVHELAGREKAVGEIHQYFPSKTNLLIALIFVDSRSLGQMVLHSLRNYVDPSVRGQIQIYHAYRSNFIKRVLTEGFKKEIIRVLICTESLTMVSVV
jgi:superfamily II DNA helicase RecQ